MDHTKRFLLDTSAFVALTDQESGYERVSELFLKAEAGELKLFACFVSLTEVQYITEYDHGGQKAREIVTGLKALPLEWIHSNDALCSEAATVKARHKVSFADAFIVAAALSADAILVHKDPEFFPLPQLKQEALPLKVGQG